MTNHEDEATLIPEDLHYTSDHEWIAIGDASAGPVPGRAVRVGITDFAQDALGDIVYVQLPDTGTVVTAGQALGEVESTKSVSEIYAPIGGTVTARNDQLTDEPELINTDPYGAGWLVEIEPADMDDLDELLDAQSYQELTTS